MPHPGISARLFVLEPLASIAPHWRHPLTKETAAFTIRKLRRLNGA
jgi:2-amino-4-hydroxy-6-hydroxymethyldihydropteridine diphosphokinase